MVRTTNWALLKRVSAKNAFVSIFSIDFDLTISSLLTKRCDPRLAALLPARTSMKVLYVLVYGPQYRALLAERHRVDRIQRVEPFFMITSTNNCASVGSKYV